MGRRPAAVAPFVQLKDGTIIHAKEAGQEMEFDNSRIVADDQAFPRNEVSMYSNGEQIFVNLRKGKFGPKVAEGKIMVYSVTNAAHYGYAYHDYQELYIQDSGSSELSYLRYRALKKMIPDQTPAGHILNGFKRTRTVARLIMVGGFASFIGGSILAGKGVMKDNGDRMTGAGLTMIFGGMGVMLGGTIPLYTNKMKMRRAIAIHNGVLPPFQFDAPERIPEK
jgi:hypothetical protein